MKLENNGNNLADGVQRAPQIKELLVMPDGKKRLKKL
jgi:hypothetical protein